MKARHLIDSVLHIPEDPITVELHPYSAVDDTYHNISVNKDNWGLYDSRDLEIWKFATDNNILVKTKVLERDVPVEVRKYIRSHPL